MDRLSELKDEQMVAAKQGWETKFKQLLDEVCFWLTPKLAFLIRVHEISNRKCLFRNVKNY